MGWNFRRSISFGPLRVNIGKTGVGYSVGGRGFRTGIRSDGRRYSRVSLLGTGVSYTAEHGRSAGKGAATGCLVPVVAGVTIAGSIYELLS